MTTKEIWQNDVTCLAKMLSEHTIDAVELLEIFLDRCAKINPHLNAFTYIETTRSVEAAKASAARYKNGASIGPLDGIPIAVKDNIFVKGMPACYGSLLYKDHIPNQDDICIERLRAAGAIILGKTTTPEFALAGRTESRLSGQTKSPWDLAMTPGGSSGGSVVALASGMAPLALGTDAGGSTRMPASYNGLFGLRPSNGSVPRRHGFPPMSLDFQVVGLLTRSSQDLKKLYGVICGPDSRDPLSQKICKYQEPHKSQVNVWHGSTSKRLRLGWFTEIGSFGCDKEVKSQVLNTVQYLKDLGHHVEEVAAPLDPDVLNPIWEVLTTAGAARMTSRFPDEWESEMNKNVIALARRGLARPSSDYVDALDQLTEFRANVSENWGPFDGFICPTAPAPIWPIDDLHPKIIGGKPGSVEHQGAFCGWVNTMGLPAVNIPVEFHPDGRPIGVQLIMRFGDDGTLLELAEALEKSMNQDQRWPEISFSA